MKNLYRSAIAIALALTVGCTGDFDKINSLPGGITADEASAKYFFTNTQVELYGPNRFPYWRGPLIHGDRFAGYFTFGFSGCWWNDGLGYTYNSGYTDATYDWLASYTGSIDNFLDITAPDAEFENELMYAVGLIQKALFFTKYTDIFGEIPYSETGNPEILSPKFDTQAEIYQGTITDLDAAMAIIGDNTATGAGVDDMGDNDLVYNGDLQKWKRLANTLKLKVGIRALGAPGASFAESAISSAISAGIFLESTDQDAKLIKDEVITQWASAAYGDIWHNFGGTGSKWHLSENMVSLLRDNNDPRLAKYAQPAQGGAMVMAAPVDAAQEKALELMKETLDKAGVTYTIEESSENVTISFAPNTYFVGQPARLNANSYGFARWEMFSTPSDEIINPKNGGPIQAEMILTSSDAFFLRALAALDGVGSSDANALYQEGVARSMEYWGVGSDAISAFLSSSPMGTLTGTPAEMKAQVNTQRWIANYTNGFEGWAIARKSGAPFQVANGVDDPDIYSMGDNNGAYPQRMKYGNAPKDKNGTNLAEAISRQGPDEIGTTLWWAKK